MQAISTGNRWRVIFIAVAFNLLFELALRGANNIRERPVLPLLLFIIYFTYFTMLEDLIVRYRLSDYHLMIASFFFGTIVLCLVSGSAFSPPLVFGINWGTLIFINVAWWGAVQALMTFYIANRLAPRDWNHRRLSRGGWILLLLIDGGIILLFQRSGLIPVGTPLGKLMMIVILVVTAIVFRATLRNAQQRTDPALRKDRVMDILSTITVALFMICVVFLSSNSIQLGASQVNRSPLQLVFGWTIILTIVMLGYRIYTKRAIPV